MCFAMLSSNDNAPSNALNNLVVDATELRSRKARTTFEIEKLKPSILKKRESSSDLDSPLDGPSPTSVSMPLIGNGNGDQQQPQGRIPQSILKKRGSFGSTAQVHPSHSILKRNSLRDGETTTSANHSPSSPPAGYQNHHSYSSSALSPHHHHYQVHPILKKSSSEERSNYRSVSEESPPGIRPILKKKTSLDTSPADRFRGLEMKPILKRNRLQSSKSESEANYEPNTTNPAVSPGGGGTTNNATKPIMKQMSKQSSDESPSSPEHSVVTQEEIEADLDKRSESLNSTANTFLTRPTTLPTRVVTQTTRRKSHPVSVEDLKPHQNHNNHHHHHHHHNHQ